MLKLLKRSKENNKKAKKKRATITLTKVIAVLNTYLLGRSNKNKW